MKGRQYMLSIFCLSLVVSPLQAQFPGDYYPSRSYSNNPSSAPNAILVQRKVSFRQDRDDTGYHLRILLQGYRPEAIEVSIAGRFLVVANKEAHQIENHNERGGYSFFSTSSSLRRRFPLPWDADVSRMQRAEKEGEIIITLPYRTYP